MAKNRDYTGLERTPSSLSWLIKERSRLKGRIDRLEQLAQQIPLELETLSQQLRSLDAVFPLHEIKVEPSVIKGKRKFAPRFLPHGAITRGIYECLRENSDNKPLYTTEIALFIARRNNLDVASVGKEKLVAHVRYRLKVLASRGEILRGHEVYVGNREEGRWCLPPDAD